MAEAITMSVREQFEESAPMKTGPSPLTDLSELSCAMTEATIDSLDLLSPAGTPMHNWFVCFSPRPKAFVVDYSDVELSPDKYPSTPPIKSIPEEMEENFDRESINEDDQDAESESSEFEVPLTPSYQNSPFVTCMSSSKGIEIILDTNAFASLVEEKNEDERAISSADIIFALAWVCFSLSILQGHKIPFNELLELLTQSTTWVLNIVVGSISLAHEIVAFLVALTGESLVETRHMANAVAAEAVCSVLGSVCIA